MTELLELTAELCAIPSVSGEERALADHVEQWLRLHAPELRVDRIRENVVARTHAHASTRVVLGGHLDTVPAAGNEEPRRDGDVLHGLGTADMKGGLAVLLLLAARVSARPPARDVTFVFYEGEEVAEERNGLRHLFETCPELVRADAAVLLEPTGGWVEAGCQGTIHVRAGFEGARAHSARPWTGVNAIHRAAPLLERLARFDAQTVDVDGLAYRESLQVVALEGGIANNVVPDRCEIVVNRRYAPNRSLDEAVAELRTLCDEADDLTVLNASVAAPPNLRAPLVAELVDLADGRVRPKLGWTDVARFAAAGIPACNLGPGDPDVAHTATEHVTVAELTRCKALLDAYVGVPD